MDDKKPTLASRALTVLHICLAGIGYHLVAVLVVEHLIH